MKRLFIAAVAAIFAVMLVAPVYAADNLELSGSMRLRAWSIDNGGFVDGNDSDWFDQRMRVKAKINVADDAYAVIRGDLGEGTWGDDFQYGIARPDTSTADGDIDNVIDFDRLYMTIDKGNWSVTIGEQYVGLGILEVVDANPTAINFGIDAGPTNLSLIYAKLDENGSTNDDGANDDEDMYAANLSFGMAAFDSNLFFAMINDDSPAEASPWALGFQTAGSLGMVNLTGELATFGGDNAANQDYVGTQFYVKADADVSDMINVGGELLYAMGSDDAGETQITNLVDWWTFTPMSNNTPGSADFSATASDPFDLATVEGAGNDGAGSQGITLFADVSPMEKLGLGAKIGYFTPEEDDATNLDSMTAFNAWVAYDIATNTTASLTYLHQSPDFDTAVANDEDRGLVYGKIQLKF